MIFFQAHNVCLGEGVGKDSYMTVVAVKKENGVVEIAADGAVTSGWTTVSNADNKLFAKIKKVGDYIIAGSGSASDVSMLMMYSKTHLIDRNDEGGVFDWFKGFLDWRKEKVNNYGIDGSNFIIVWGDKVYYIEDFMVYEIQNYYSIGSGRDFAMAAMHMGGSVVDAVKCAIKFDSFCGEPVTKF